MFRNQFQNLVFVGAHSDALPIGENEPLMAAHFQKQSSCG